MASFADRCKSRTLPFRLCGRIGYSLGELTKLSIQLQVSNGMLRCAAIYCWNLKSLDSTSGIMRSAMRHLWEMDILGPFFPFNLFSPFPCDSLRQSLSLCASLFKFYFSSITRILIFRIFFWPCKLALVFVY